MSDQYVDPTVASGGAGGTSGVEHGERPDASSLPDRPKLLEKALGLIYTDRGEEYGHPADDFARIADYWTTYLGDRLAGDIEPRDVAAMMVLLKMGRLSYNLRHEDSWVDIAGYAGCVDRIDRREDGLE